jgi:hypothetical protein
MSREAVPVTRMPMAVFARNGNVVVPKCEVHGSQGTAEGVVTTWTRESYRQMTCNKRVIEVFPQQALPPQRIANGFTAAFRGANTSVIK